MKRRRRELPPVRKPVRKKKYNQPGTCVHSPIETIKNGGPAMDEQRLLETALDLGFANAALIDTKDRTAVPAV